MIANRKRTFSFRADAASGDTVPCVLSTEEPVDRGDFIEVLSHSPASVDLSRAPLPLCVAHDTGPLPVGVVESLQLGGGKLRGIARFSSSPMAQQILSDIKSGIVRSLSVGYRLLKELKTMGRTVVFSWEPYEASIVSVPADPNAGFYRSLKMDKSHNDTSTDSDDLNSEDTSTQTRSQRRAVNAATNRERERVAELTGIFDLARKNCDITNNDLNKAINEGWSIEKFRVLALDKIDSRTTYSDARYGPGCYMSGDGASREWHGMLNDYSLARAIQTIIDPASGLRAGGSREREISEELSRRIGGKPSAGGIYVPDEIMFKHNKRTVVVGSDHTGGGALHMETFAADLFTDVLRARTIVGRLGCRVMNGMSGDVLIPRKTTAGMLGWQTETGTGSSTDPNFDQLKLSPKRITAYTDFSRQLLIQGSLDAQILIQDDLMRGALVELDRVSLSGSGAGNEPLGIIGVSGIGSVVGGTNGATIAWSHIIDLESAVADVNADFGSLGYAVNPKTRAKLKTVQKGTSLEMCWSDEPLDISGTGQLNGYVAATSTLLRNNLDKGTSTGVCSELIYGDWSSLIVARFGGNEITVDPYTLATSGKIRVTINLYADSGVRQAASFAVMSDALT